ncbi:MAG: hypothetical protein PVF73_06355 [Bacteroidales bacterium]
MLIDKNRRKRDPTTRNPDDQPFGDPLIPVLYYPGSPAQAVKYNHFRAKTGKRTKYTAHSTRDVRSWLRISG